VVHGSKLAEPEPKGSLAMKTIGSVSPSDAGRRSDSDWIGRGKCRFGSWRCKNAATRDDDRINVLPNRVQALEDWRALLILVELRKFILVASQFFEFLHGLGQQQTSRRFLSLRKMKRRDTSCGNALSDSDARKGDKG
jgi:hypothetical protein